MFKNFTIINYLRKRLTKWFIFFLAEVISVHEKSKDAKITKINNKSKAPIKIFN